MELEVYFNNYNQVLNYMDELKKAYKLIHQRYYSSISLVISGQDLIDLAENAIMYKVYIKLIKDGEDSTYKQIR